MAPRRICLSDAADHLCTCPEYFQGSSPLKLAAKIITEGCSCGPLEMQGRSESAALNAEDCNLHSRMDQHYRSKLSHCPAEVNKKRSRVQAPLCRNSARAVEEV